jgi:uncharacterized membrane protein YedE/YeeE
MIVRISSWLARLLFGVGLAVAGMTLPPNVQAFLDVFGDWNPSLALVMIGAIGVHFVAFRLIMRRRAPLFDARFHLPTRKDLDWRLLSGAALFGAGWGLGGFCPGPALTSVAAGSFSAIVFVAAMTAGMLLEHVVSARLSQLESLSWRSNRSMIRPPTP